MARPWNSVESTRQVETATAGRVMSSEIHPEDEFNEQLHRKAAVVGLSQPFRTYLMTAWSAFR
ncbi:hypothetical protein RJZ56_007108 [Blastomyces dermatitidis]